MVETEPFAGRLLQGERVLWSGRPTGGVLLSGRDAFLIPFSIVWCGFVTVWSVIVFQIGPIRFSLIGLVFLAVGMFVILGRFFLDAWIRDGISYALTDRRVLIARKRPTSVFTALGLDQLPAASIAERKDGAGTIRFGEPLGLSNWRSHGLSIWTPTLDPVPQFIRIADSREVFDLIQTTTIRQR